MRLEEHWKKSNSKTCDGKKTFPSYRLAAEFNNRQRRPGSAFRSNGKELEKMHVYCCKRCHQYHIGHDVRNRRDRLVRLRRQQDSLRRERFRK